MPITITQPLPNQATGPGFTVTGSTDIGPTPVDDFWLVKIVLSSDDNAVLIYGCKKAGGFTTFSVQVGGQADCAIGLTQGLVSVPQGAAARLIVEQRHANSTIVDSISIPVIWDGVAQVWNYGTNLAGWAGGTTQGGFSPSDRDKLQLVLDAVYREWPSA